MKKVIAALLVTAALCAEVDTPSTIPQAAPFETPYEALPEISTPKSPSYAYVKLGGTALPGYFGIGTGIGYRFRSGAFGGGPVITVGANKINQGGFASLSLKYDLLCVPKSGEGFYFGLTPGLFVVPDKAVAPTVEAVFGRETRHDSGRTNHWQLALTYFVIPTFSYGWGF